MKKSEELKDRINDLDDNDSDLKYLGLHKRVKRATNVEEFVENILPLLIEKEYNVNEFSTNSFRITKNNIILDYYPASKKLFDKRKPKWFENISNKKLLDQLEKLIK